jgi:hypothetical protein
MRERFFFGNGYGASVISNVWSLGGMDGLYELAVLEGDEKKSNICYSTPITDDVIGYLTWEEVAKLLLQIQGLPPVIKEEAK